MRAACYRLPATSGLAIALLAANASASSVYFLRNSVDYPTGSHLLRQKRNFDRRDRGFERDHLLHRSRKFRRQSFRRYRYGAGISLPPRPSGSLTIGQATSSTPTVFLASAATNADETGVTITGATGTGFFIPTFRIQNRARSTTTTPASRSGYHVRGPQQQLLTVHPRGIVYRRAAHRSRRSAIDSTTQFTFGTPFDFGISMALFFSARTVNRPCPARL